MSSAVDGANALVGRLAGREVGALGALLDAYRARLRAEVTIKLAADVRLASRLDASDVNVDQANNEQVN